MVGTSLPNHVEIVEFTHRVVSVPLICQSIDNVLLGVRPFHARWAWVASMRAGLSLRAARYSSRAENYSMARKRSRLTGTWLAEKAKRNAIIKEFTIEPHREKSRARGGLLKWCRFSGFSSFLWVCARTHALSEF